MVARFGSLLMTLATACVLAVGCADEGLVKLDAESRVELSYPGSPIVTIRVAFRTGSINDPVGQTVFLNT